MTRTVLILGGTKEAAELASSLTTEHPDWRVITSLAGRTREPQPVAGETRIGGFGGVDGLIDYVKGENVDQIIDATHPFARQISENAARAAKAIGVPLERCDRPPWQKQPGDQWTEVSDLPAARDAIPEGARVLLALGSQHIALFAGRDDVHFVVRMVDPPGAPLALPDHQLLLGKPGNEVDEEKLLTEHKITHIICRNSGGSGAYAKIKAARKLGLPVIMVQRS